MGSRMSAHGDRIRGVLFVDVDGTLVGPDGVAERVWAPLAALRRSGWRISVCTGRPGRGVARDIAWRLDPEGLHVFESGAVVMHARGDVVTHAPLPGEAVHGLAAVGAREGATLEAYTADARYLVAERDPLVVAHEALLGFDAEVVPWPPALQLVRMQWVVPHAAWPRLEAAARDALALVEAHEGRSPRMPGVAFVSMTAPGVSKGTGVRAVLARYGLAREDAAMAGDNLNDLLAFDAVGTVFVAADGDPLARARADVIIGGPAEGGVADAAHHLMSRG